MKKDNLILLIGNYKALNLGDDLLMFSALQGIKEVLPDFKIKVVTAGKGGDLRLLPAGIMSFLRFRWIKTIFAMLKARYAVFGGGGLLNVEECKSLWIWGVQIWFLKLFRVKIILLANSITQTDSKILKYLLKKVDFITVRDLGSFRFLNSLSLKIPIVQTTDLVFALRQSYQDLSKSKIPKYLAEEYIAINLRDYSLIDRAFMAELLKDLIIKIASKSTWHIVFYGMHSQDLNFIQKLLLDLDVDNGRLHFAEHKLETINQVLLSANFVVAERLHAGLLGALLEKPLVMLSYSEKISNLFENDLPEIKLFNLRDYNLESVDLLVSEIWKLIGQNSVCDYQNSLLELETLANKNFWLLKSYIESDI